MLRTGRVFGRLRGTSAVRCVLVVVRLISSLTTVSVYHEHEHDNATVSSSLDGVMCHVSRIYVSAMTTSTASIVENGASTFVVVQLVYVRNVLDRSALLCCAPHVATTRMRALPRWQDHVSRTNLAFWVFRTIPLCLH